MSKNQSEFSRRAVVKAAAWAAPVVAVAAAAPIAAASVTPLPKRFYSEVILGGSEVNGDYPEISSNAANVRLEGAPGDTTGEIVMEFTLPVGYTWQGNDQFGNWDGPEIFDDQGQTVVRYTHAPITIAAGANSATAYFFGGKATGTGASRSNPMSLDYYSDQFPGGGSSSYPRRGA